jgi:DNA-binding NarL/FixJ family response regulator
MMTLADGCDVIFGVMRTLLLADDSLLIRSMIKRILIDEPTIVVLGEAENFEEAIEKAADLKPDILLLDLHMPDDRTLSADYIKTSLRPLGSEIKIIGMSLSGNEDAEMKELGASLGACTVLEKARFEEELIPAILSC